MKEEGKKEKHKKKEAKKENKERVPSTSDVFFLLNTFSAVCMC
jgi:hypothetical protein